MRGIQSANNVSPAFVGVGGHSERGASVSPQAKKRKAKALPPPPNPSCFA